MGSGFRNPPQTDTSTNNPVIVNTIVSRGSSESSTTPSGKARGKREPEVPASNYEIFERLIKADEGRNWPSNEDLEREVFRN